LSGYIGFSSAQALPGMRLGSEKYKTLMRCVPFSSRTLYQIAILIAFLLLNAAAVVVAV
jgi:hypothetical protein